MSTDSAELLSELDSVVSEAERLYREQLELEKDSAVDSAGRVERMIAGRRGRSTDPTRATLTILSDTLKAIVGEKRKGRRYHFHEIVHEFGAENVAWTTIKIVLGYLVAPLTKDDLRAGFLKDGESGGVELNALAKQVRNALVDEVKFHRLRRKAPGLFDHHIHDLTSNLRTSSKKFITRRLNAAIDYADVNTLDLDQLRLPTNSAGLQIGKTLVDLLVSHGMRGLLCYVEKRSLSRERSVTTKRGGRVAQPDAKTFLAFTPEGLKWAEKRKDLLIRLRPLLRPMVHPPEPWAKRVHGGYLERQKYSVSLLRDAAEAPEWEHGLYDAVNAVQDTAWRINRRVFEELVFITDNTVGAIKNAKVPRIRPLELPPKPVTRESAEWSQWKKRAGKIRTENKIIAERAALFRSRVREHGRYITATASPSFWFPFKIDFRGRLYPLPNNGMTPQGTDWQKGVLEFADGKPLGKHGEKWLALHGASMLDETFIGIAGAHVSDVSKRVKMGAFTLEQRIEYIRSITPLIAEIAARPRDVLLWQDADKPFQFLAFVFEWAELHRLRRAGREHEFVSHIPVSIDGTCNGLQHYAAILRDEKLAKAVNVSDSTHQQDVYQLVADTVRSQLEDSVNDSDAMYDSKIRRARSEKSRATYVAKKKHRREMARLWIANDRLIGRKLTKQSCMTLVYGAGITTFKDSVMDYLEEKDATGDFGDDQQLRDAVAFMGGQIRTAIKHHAPSAIEAMNWLRAAAERLASSGHHVNWPLPLVGHIVRQSYVTWPEEARTQVKTVLHGQVTIVNRDGSQRITDGKVHKPLIPKEGTEVIDVKAHRRGIAPSLIHSLDAACLYLAVFQASGRTRWALFQPHDIDDATATSFLLVHDSYGTHAADMELLAASTREAFLKVHTAAGFRDDPDRTLLDDLRGHWQRTFGVDVGAPPKPGKLDVSVVLDSTYFFS